MRGRVAARRTRGNDGLLCPPAVRSGKAWLEVVTGRWPNAGPFGIRSPQLSFQLVRARTSVEKRFAGLDISEAHQAGTVIYQVPSWVNFRRSGSVA